MPFIYSAVAGAGLNSDGTGVHDDNCFAVDRKAGGDTLYVTALELLDYVQSEGIAPALSPVSAIANTALPRVANLAALRANTATPSGPIYLTEITAGSGWGGGVFQVKAGDSTADNGGTVIVDQAGNHWWRQLPLGWVSPSHFGGYPGASGAVNLAASQAVAIWLYHQGGGVYFLEPGEWVFSCAEPTVISSNIDIIGARGSVIIPDLTTIPDYLTMPFPQAYGGIFVSGNPVTLVSGASYAGARSGSTHGGGGGAVDLGWVDTTTLVSNIRVGGVTIDATKPGSGGGGPGGAIYTGPNFLAGYLLCGIFFWFASTVRVIDCVMIGLPNDGISVNAGKDVKIRGNHVEICGYWGQFGGTRNGISTDGWMDNRDPTQTASGLEISGNTVIGCHDEGIENAIWDGTEIFANTLIGNGDKGIEGNDPLATTLTMTGGATSGTFPARINAAASTPVAIVSGGIGGAPVSTVTYNASAAAASGSVIKLGSNITNITVGMPIAGTNIAAGAYVTDIDVVNQQFFISAPVTGSGVASGAALVFSSTVTLTGTTGTGTVAELVGVTNSSGVLVAITAVLQPGIYWTLPTAPAAEPFAGSTFTTKPVLSLSMIGQKIPGDRKIFGNFIDGTIPPNVPFNPAGGAYTCAGIAISDGNENTIEIRANTIKNIYPNTDGATTPAGISVSQSNNNTTIVEENYFYNVNATAITMQSRKVIVCDNDYYNPNPGAQTFTFLSVEGAISDWVCVNDNRCFNLNDFFVYTVGNINSGTTVISGMQIRNNRLHTLLHIPVYMIFGKQNAGLTIECIDISGNIVTDANSTGHNGDYKAPIALGTSSPGWGPTITNLVVHDNVIAANGIDYFTYPIGSPTASWAVLPPGCILNASVKGNTFTGFLYATSLPYDATAATASGNVVTLGTANIENVIQGMTVTHAAVPAGTTVVSVNYTSGTFVMSAAVTGSGILNGDVVTLSLSGPSVTDNMAAIVQLDEDGNGIPGRRNMYLAAPPANGVYVQGDHVTNTAPVNDGIEGWRCTSSGAYPYYVSSMNGNGVASGGSGFPASSSFTMTGTTGAGTLATFTCTTNSSGVITSAVVLTAGAYTTKPTTPAAEPVTGSSGTGAVLDFNLAYNGQLAVWEPGTGAVAGVHRVLHRRRPGRREGDGAVRGGPGLHASARPGWKPVLPGYRGDQQFHHVGRAHQRRHHYHAWDRAVHAGQRQRPERPHLPIGRSPACRRRASPPEQRNRHNRRRLLRDAGLHIAARCRDAILRRMATRAAP